MVRIDDATLPILCFQSIGKSTREDIALIRPVYFRVFARKQPIIALSDARYASHAADQRKLWAEWLAEVIREDVHGCSLATVVMLNSGILRGALIALNWITPPKAPQHVVGEADEALEECRKLVARHQLNVSSQLWGQIRLWLDHGERLGRAGT